MNLADSKETSITTMNNKRLIVVVGPTGSGKTDTSIRLALHYGTPILSTDSRQMYKGMAIGTAQPTQEQLQTVKHYFIASHDIKCDLNCGQYADEALKCLDELFKTYDQVIAVGGSGLYVQALCEGLDDLPERDETLRTELTRRLENEGIESLLAQLKQLDPVFYDQVDRNNPSRVMRALEVCLQTGHPYSELRIGNKTTRPFDICKIGLDLPRPQLYDRINRRVDQMLADGLEAEARALYPYRSLNALQTVGYREFFDFFDDKISREEAVELIKRNSRRYAKRQITWFRRDPAIRWFAPDDFDAMIRYLDFGNLQ